MITLGANLTTRLNAGEKPYWLLKLFFNDDYILNVHDDDEKRKRGSVLDSGVSRVMILALSPQCTDKYDNVDAIMSELKIKQLHVHARPNTQTHTQTQTNTNKHMCLDVWLRTFRTP